MHYAITAQTLARLPCFWPGSKTPEEKMPHKKIATPPTGSAATSVLNAPDYSPHNHLATSCIAHAARYISGTGYFRDSHEIGTTARNLGSFTDPGERGLNFQEMHHHHGGILRTRAKALVIENTTFIRSNRPDSAVLSCPNPVTGFGADGPFCEDGRTAITSVFNICPPTLENVGDPKTRYRSMTMPTGTSTGASAQTTHDHHQAALVLRAQNHLALALFELRNNTGSTPTRKAMGLAYAAGRALSQVVGGAV